jgi:two-component system, LytTR family, response regulator
MVYLKDGTKILTSKNIGLFDSVLPREIFVRINRTFVVRVKAICNWEETSQSYLRLTLINGKIFDVSRRKKIFVRQYLSPKN